MTERINKHLENLGRAALYTVYNLGFGIPIGLARTIISVAFVAKHTFYAKKYASAGATYKERLEDQAKNKSRQRELQLKKEKEKTREAKGLNKVLHWGREKLSEVKNEMGEFKDNLVLEVKTEANELITENITKEEKDRKAKWHGHLLRGVTEIFYFGAPYYTYQDNFSSKYKAAVFQLKDLVALIREEKATDREIRGLLTSSVYNPLF